MDSLVTRLRTVALLAKLAASAVAIVFAAPMYAQARIDGELLSDPTRPIREGARREGRSAQEETELATRVYSVGFVRVSSRSSIAVVNGMQVSSGQEIDGAKVVSITAQGVTLDVAGETQLIAPFGSIVTRFLP